jgi:preprotein translocase subunit SecG
MFTTLILIIHIIVCIALILMVLVQSGKGADIGAVFGGGGSQTVFGSAGATPFLSKVIIGASIVFMVTSIALTYISGKKGSSITEGSIMNEQTTAPSSTPAIPRAKGTESSKAVAPKAKSESAKQPAAAHAPSAQGSEKAPKSE